MIKEFGKFKQRLFNKNIVSGSYRKLRLPSDLEGLNGRESAKVA